ncbi:cotranscriptional regulator FAM172A [Ictalurus punctatus]|uniref:Cotranscriptional regulator FAM172A n=1 Tax=Ictalurus punctatus TaxID=7998 RepID=A0A2D0Q2R5_ICTPU|nr:cotranscriptional regulator FAM172A [Ictalurus punctatus]
MLFGRHTAQVIKMECSEVSNKTPSDFPYSFTEDGRLCHIDTLKPYKFSFQLKDVQATMREHTSLCCYISQHVYSLFEKKYNLIKVYLDKGSQSDFHPPGFVYMSPGALEHHGTLMVLIQDKGTIRCGVWSWRAVANEGLERGSQIPYVRWALGESCAVLLMNPNEGVMAPEEHVQQVWDQLLLNSTAEQITVVAHGYGGLAFVQLLCCRLEEIQQRKCAVAFIDSSHSLWHQPLGTSGRDWIKVHSSSWVLSSEPKNRLVGYLKAGCRMMSAGTQCHETAPAACMDSVFRFIAKLMKPAVVPTPFCIVTRSRSLGARKLSGITDRNNNAS